MERREKRPANSQPLSSLSLLGYHRLWAHRSYNAAPPLQYAFAALGAGAVEGSIKWWARGHRAHHRYTDTDLDPYNAHKGASSILRARVCVALLPRHELILNAAS